VAVLLFAFAQLWISDMPKQTVARYGITFSTLYTKQLGLNVQETYQALVEELGVRVVRLPIPWSDVESTQGTFQWDEYDQIIRYSQGRDVKLTLAIGEKVPRWPECYVPDWAEGFSIAQKDEHVRAFMKAVVERYRSFSVIERWQVENEPLFPFGNCTNQISLEELDRQVELVRSLDERPIQLTVSGELGPWKPLAQRSDILGLSMYRKTWNEAVGSFVYPLSPEYYQLRAQVVRESTQQLIVSELQAEPWFPESFDRSLIEEAYQLFPKEQFTSNLDFVRESGISEAYLWGAEWWYYLKTHGETRLWETAQTVFNPS